MPNKKKKGRFLQELPWYLYLFPTVGMLCFVSFYPMLKTIALSFYVSNNGNLEKYAGLFNYQNLFVSEEFYNALYNTVYIGFFSMLIGVPSSFLLANMINRALHGKSMLKVLYFLPNVTASVAVVLLFKVLFFPSNAGIVNYFLSMLGIATQTWMNDPSLSKWVIITISIWQGTGFNILIWMAGLQSISNDLYEAARVDGASRWRELWNITLPGVRPVFWFFIITGVIGGFQRFDDAYVFGGAIGSPLRSIQTVVMFFFEETMEKSQYGYGAAACVTLFVFIMVMTFLNLKLSNNREN